MKTEGGDFQLLNKSHESGFGGEMEITKYVACPGCNSPLVLLPKGFPLYDIQCSRCIFRAQVKTNRCAPKGQIFGAGYDILESSRRAGQLIPPLIAHFNWVDKSGDGSLRREVYFFPFLTDSNIRLRVRSAGGARPGYREFNYVGLFNDNVARMCLFRDSSTS